MDELYKVCYVAKGYAQQPDVDYNKGYGQLCSVTSEPPSRLIDLSLLYPAVSSVFLHVLVYRISYISCLLATPLLLTLLVLPLLHVHPH